MRCFRGGAQWVRGVGRRRSSLAVGAVTLALIVQVCIVPLPAAAPVDAKTQLVTAITHAGFAGDGQSVGYVRTHLGHALNCLEGSKGKNFNPAWGNVCQEQGNGILIDLASTPGGATVMLVATQAGALAVAGTKSANTRIAAKGVRALLRVVTENLK